MPPSNAGKQALRVVVLIALGTGAGIADSAMRPVKVTPDAPPPIEEVIAGHGAGQPLPTGANPVPARPPQGAPQAKPAETAKPYMITVEQARKLFETDQADFIDARPETEYAEGHIRGALSIPIEAFAGQIPERLKLIPDRARVIIVYCSGGNDCKAAEDVMIELQALKYSKIYVIQAGFPGWKEAGLPVDQGSPP